MTEPFNVVSLADVRERRASMAGGSASLGRRPEIVRGVTTFTEGVELLEDDIADWCALTNKMLAERGLSERSAPEVFGIMAAKALTVLLREPEAATRIINGNEGVTAALAPVLERLRGPANVSEQDYMRGQMLCLFAKMYLPVAAFAVFRQDFL